MSMGLEGSISSWIGKIREEFDTFCSETKEILHQKPVENVQEQLITAGESLKQMLNVFSSFKLDEMEVRMDLHAGIDDQKDIISEEKEIELLKLKLATGIDDRKDMIAEPTPKDIVCICTYDIFEELEYLHAQSMVSTDKSDSISDSKFCTWTQDYTLTEEEPHSDEIQNSDYSHLLGQELRAELIKQGFLSPRSGSDSVQSIMSESSEEIGGSDSSLDDKVTSSVDRISSRMSDVALDYNSALQSRLLDFSFLDNSDTASIPDMSDYWSSSKQSPVCDVVVAAELNQENAEIVQELNQENAEIVQDNDWVKLDENLSDEDWEIV